MEKELGFLSKKELIPGPEEGENDFLKRAETVKNILEKKLFFLQKAGFEADLVPKSFFSWAKSSLSTFYDISFSDLLIIFSDKNLRFFQGGATWTLEEEGVKIPVIQLRKALKKGSYLGLYQFDEILIHEAVHALRIGFDEPKYEELFAYLPSSSSFRKCLGPIIRKEREALIFVALAFFTLAGSILPFFGEGIFWSFFSITSKFALFFYVALGSFRLFFSKLKFKRAFSKLSRVIGRKALAVMFRLKDREIEKISKLKEKEIVKFFVVGAESSFRLKNIYLSYFCEGGRQE